MKYFCFLTLILSTLLIESCKPEKNISLSNLKGRWANKLNDFIEINDTSSNNFVYNYLEINGIGDDKYLEIKKDTLSFQNRYYFSSNYERLIIERFDFLIMNLSDSFMVLSPISNYSLKIAKGEKLLHFIRQEYLEDNSINFEKIVFHTTFCYGACPTYHLEIDKIGNYKLHKEIVYKNGIRPLVIDSTKIGFYSGKLSDRLLNELVKSLKTCNLETLKFEDIDCCDGSIFTIIVYYNGKRKYLKSMFPPRISQSLTNKLIEICDQSGLTKSINRFVLQD